LRMCQGRQRAHMRRVCCICWHRRSRAAAAGPAEAELLRALRHPNVVMYLGASLVPGEQVRSRRASGPVACRRCAAALCCLCTCAPRRARSA